MMISPTRLLHIFGPLQAGAGVFAQDRVNCVNFDAKPRLLA